MKMIHQAGGHANHLIYRDSTAQIVTASSGARQQRLDAWLRTRGTTPLSTFDALAILSDSENAKLPIYRQAADDPDDENTLATMVYRLSQGEVNWSLWRRNRQTPTLQGKIAVPLGK